MVMQMYNQSPLPSTHQQVSWIQGGNGQYIDTGIVPNYYTGIEAGGVFDVGNGYYTNLGSRISLSSTAYALMVDGTNLRWSYGTNNNKGLGISDCIKFSFIPGIDLVLRYERSNGTTGSVTITSKSFSPALTHNFYIGALNNNGSVAGGSERIAYLKMYDSTTLVRDYLPCYRKSDNKTGMYDLVTNTFYPNLGSEEFTVGSNV